MLVKTKKNTSNRNKHKTRKNIKSKQHGSGFIFDNKPINDTPRSYEAKYANNNYKFIITCVACKNKTFFQKTVKQETSQAQFFGVGETARNATSFICSTCGFINTYDSVLKYVQV